MAVMHHPDQRVRAIRRLADGAVDEVVREVRRLAVDPFTRGGKGLRDLGVAFASVGLIYLLAWAHVDHTTLVDKLSAESATLPVAIALFRLPLSTFAPAPNLPMWGSLVQVLICFGIAELALGRRTLLVMALLTTALATLAGRAFFALGAHAPLHLGLSRAGAGIRDTGPSAAVVGVGVYVGIRKRVPILLGILVSAMLVEVFVLANLAGREHVVAMLVGTAAAAPFIRNWVRDVRSRRRVREEGRVEEPVAA